MMLLATCSTFVKDLPDFLTVHHYLSSLLRTAHNEEEHSEPEGRQQQHLLDNLCFSSVGISTMFYDIPLATSRIVAHPIDYSDYTSFLLQIFFLNF